MHIYIYIHIHVPIHLHTGVRGRSKTGVGLTLLHAQRQGRYMIDAVARGTEVSQLDAAARGTEMSQSLSLLPLTGTKMCVYMRASDTQHACLHAHIPPPSPRTHKDTHAHTQHAVSGDGERHQGQDPGRRTWGLRGADRWRCNGLLYIHWSNPAGGSTGLN